MKKNKSVSFLELFMGLLVGFPALTTDLYLPGFPELTRFFGTNASGIQMSLMATMVGIALGQLVIGPLSDKYGRKSPLMIGLFLFVITTYCCLFTTNIRVFILLRFLEGLSCSCGMVLSRAIITDTFSGHRLAKSLSINTAILGFTPTIAPVLGGIILTFFSWQGEFVFLLIISIIFLLSSMFIHESLPLQKRKQNEEFDQHRPLSKIFSHRTFMSNVLIYSFATAVMFAYIASSPFVFQDHFRISPLQYSILFGMNALALTLGSLLASRFEDQEKVLQIGASGLMVMAVITVIVLFSGSSFAFFESSLFVMFLFNGLVYPSSTTLALESNRENAGTASAILGAMSFLFGGIVSPLVGIGQILYGISIAIIVCSSMVFLLVMYRMMLRRKQWVMNNQ